MESFVGQGKHVVALSSGTAALHLALLLCGVEKGDEVIVQSFTFCASSNPVAYLGANPVFVDSEAKSWNLSPDMLECAIKSRISETGKCPKAIIPVALYGMPYDVDAILKIAAKYNIPVVEDAAEGFGSRWNGRVLGTFGDYGVLSFNGNKMITTSGGGALICPSEEAKRKAMWLATQAREAYPYYHHLAIGYNYRMSNICAGIGRGQMHIVNEHIMHHKHVHELYENGMKNVKGVEIHSNPTALSDSNYWLCTLLLDENVEVKGQGGMYRDAASESIGGIISEVHKSKNPHTDCEPNPNVEALRVWLDKKGIESRPLWKPMHKQPVYESSVAYCNGVSEALFKKGLCLPSGPMVSDRDVEYIIQCICEAIV